MKTVIFTEDELCDLGKISKELFSDENDPRSSAYVRKLNRPKIRWGVIILNVIIPLLAAAALVFALSCFGISLKAAILIASAVLVLYIILTLKRTVVCAVRIYQRYAPDSVRNKCRFEPSCSEYMILAVEEYGLIKGLRKGICRLKRCNTDGGGYDFP